MTIERRYYDPRFPDGDNWCEDKNGERHVVGKVLKRFADNEDTFVYIAQGDYNGAKPLAYLYHRGLGTSWFPPHVSKRIVESLLD